MRKIRMLIFAVTVACCTPMYVHVAHWTHTLPTYLSAAFLVSVLVMISWHTRQISRWMMELMMPGLLSIRDSLGSLLIWISRRMRHFGDRLFTAGFRMLIVNKVRIRGGV